MKNILFILAIFLIASCKKESENKIDYKKETLEVTTSIYPENVTKVFDAHGGLEQWNKMQRLTFGMEIPEGNEVTITELKSRKSLIKTDLFKIGFDGENVWIDDAEKAYKGNPKFYYNLMFYFYAMPFVLADNGIVYEDVDPSVFEDKLYPGIKISYENGIGESPEDEYILYYNPDTYQMEWLGYTVTYFSKEKGKEFHFIKYSNWQKVNGLKLPETLTWYNYEDNKPTIKRNDLKFTNIMVSDKKESDAIFKKPDNAVIVE